MASTRIRQPLQVQTSRPQRLVGHQRTFLCTNELPRRGSASSSRHRFRRCPNIGPKRAEECAAAWHVLHSAALFARALNQRVTVPDFVVQAAGGELIYVEAKLLMRSEIEEDFVTYAKQIQSRVFAIFQPLNQLNPFVKIIIQDPQVTPAQDEVLDNILVDSPPLAAMSFAAYRGCTVLAPRAPYENLRVFDRAKKAGKQLKASDEHGIASLFC